MSFKCTKYFFAINVEFEDCNAELEVDLIKEYRNTPTKKVKTFATNLSKRYSKNIEKQ